MDALNYLAQEASAILETATILTRTSVCAQKFVAQIAVTVLDVHEIEAQLPSRASCGVKILDDSFDFRVGQEGIVVWQIQAAIQNRVAIENARLRVVVNMGPAIAAGVCELNPDEQVVVRAHGPAVLRNQYGAQPRDIFPR